MRRTTGYAAGMFVVLLVCTSARAQDVPGIEICTVDKTMERRTSCLQSNVDFLVKTINRLRSDQEQKLAAASAKMEMLNNAVIALQKTVADLQGATKVTPPASAAVPETKEVPAAKDAPPKK